MKRITKKARVLIVDDEPDLSDQIAQYLSRVGFDVVTSPNGIDAEYIFNRDHPDAVVTDYRMPGRNGVDLLVGLKRINENVPVLLMSGHADMQVCLTALKENAFEFLEKPVDLERLVELLQRALAGEKRWWDE